MRLKDWDEKGFIKHVLGAFALTARPDKFDDAVIIDLAPITGQPDANYLVYSIDQPSFVSHPDPAVDPFRFYGRWVAGVTCNDVIAMGARCRGFSLALAAPPELETDRVESLLCGIRDVLARCGADYEGGNLDSGELGTVGMAWGLVSRHGIVRRGGARPGDLIVVTGELGLGWLEYQLRKHKLDDRLSAADAARLRRYKDMPVGEAAAIAAVAERGLFSSGMDLSDGLVEFLYTIADRSGAGCVIDLDTLPVSADTRRNLPLLLPVLPESADVLRRYPDLIALDPGYDSPLLHGFTVPAGQAAEAARICAEHGSELHVIGRVVPEPLVIADLGDRRVEVPGFWDDQLRQEDGLSAWTMFLRAFR
ncbi:MAG: thiamine-phosphate kinase [Streptosporangiaceae bacterium]